MYCPYCAQPMALHYAKHLSRFVYACPASGMELSLRFQERLLALVSAEAHLGEAVAGSSQLHCPRCACRLDDSSDGGLRCPRCSMALSREDRRTLIELHPHARTR